MSIEIVTDILVTPDRDKTVNFFLNDTVPIVNDLYFVKKLDSRSYKFSQTSFNNWTPSTTAATMLATQTLGTTFTATNLLQHDYWIRWRIDIDVKYNAGTANAKAMTERVVGENWYAITRRPSTPAYFNSGTRNQNVAESISNYWACAYRTAADTLSIGYSPSYAFYPANSAPSLSSTSAASPTITVKTPVFNMRCSTTYLSTALANKIDKDASTLKLECDIYVSKNVGYRRSMIQENLIETWQKGITV